MRRVLSDQEIARMRAVGTYAFNHDATEQDSPTPPDAEAVARQALDRCYEGAVERGGYDVSAYCEARDAFREAVERRVRLEMAQEATDAIARLSAVPMRSLSPEEMAVLMFANKAIAAVGHLAHHQQDTP